MGAQSPLPPELAEWLQFALEVPREDLFARHQSARPERRQKRIRMQEYAYEQWLTIALSQLRIPHRSGATVGVHRVAIVFPKQKHAIDVLSLEDLSTPEGRTLGSADLRRRQCTYLGWVIHSVTLRDLYTAATNRSMRLLVSRLLSSFDPAAARRASFRDSVVNHSRPHLRIIESKQSVQRGLQGRGDLSDDENGFEVAKSHEFIDQQHRDPRSFLHENAVRAASAA